MNKTLTDSAETCGCSLPNHEGKAGKKRSLKFNQVIYGWVFLAPTILFFTVFTFAPLFMSIYFSLTDFNMVKASWVGFENYKYVFTNSYYMRSLLNVIIYAAMSVPVVVISSLLVANLVNQKMRGVKVFRMLYYIPAVTSGVATSFVWKWILNKNYGLFNTILGTQIPWLTDMSYLPLFSIVIVTSWSALGGNMLIYLAGLRGISDDMYEAADIDGAGYWRKLFSITMPLLSSTTYFILTMTIIGSFQLFDQVYMITGGGPGGYTQMPVLQIYDMTGKFFAGRGSAMSVVLFVLIMVVTFITQKFTKETY